MSPHIPPAFTALCMLFLNIREIGPMEITPHAYRMTHLQPPPCESSAFDLAGFGVPIPLPTAPPAPPADVMTPF